MLLTFKRRSVLMVFAIMVLALVNSATALAGGQQQLKQFYQNTQAMTADFHQVVSDRQGRKVQEVDGKMMIQRPNRFRWDYQKPFEQEIVSDGEYVYLYDVELEQVTVNPVSKTLGASPAALLSGSDDLSQNFTLADVDKGDTLEWVQVNPKQNDTGFNQIELGFGFSGELAKMLLVDSFGQQTAITFKNQNDNPTIPADIFIFKAPEGVDVLGQ